MSSRSMPRRLSYIVAVRKTRPSYRPRSGSVAVLIPPKSLTTRPYDMREDFLPAQAGDLRRALPAHVGTGVVTHDAPESPVIHEPEQGLLDLLRRRRMKAGHAVLDTRVDERMGDDRHAQSARFQPTQV